LRPHDLHILVASSRQIDYYGLAGEGFFLSQHISESVGALEGRQNAFRSAEEAVSFKGFIIVADFVSHATLVLEVAVFWSYTGIV
jgi:hypothetical protein